MKENLEKSTSELIPLPSTKKIDLHNLTAIRREMNSVYRDARNGKIEDAAGTKLIYMLSIITKVYESEVLEADLREIKNTLQIRQNTEKEQSRK